MNRKTKKKLDLAVQRIVAIFCFMLLITPLFCATFGFICLLVYDNLNTIFVPLGLKKYTDTINLHIS